MPRSASKFYLGFCCIDRAAHGNGAKAMTQSGLLLADTYAHSGGWSAKRMCETEIYVAAAAANLECSLPFRARPYSSNQATFAERFESRPRSTSAALIGLPK